jgi:glycosyltransferase involved in cell wall biosynthesis
MFDSKFYMKHYPDLKKAGVTTHKLALNHWNKHGKKEGRICNAKGNVKPGINLIGYVNGMHSLRSVANTLMKCFELQNMPYVFNDKDNIYAYHIYAVGLLNLKHLTAKYSRGGTNILVFFWETETIPLDLQKYFYYFDEIWCFSSFCKIIIQKYVTVPIMLLPYPIEIVKDNIVDVYIKFNIPKSKFTCLFIFSYGSTFNRKNPLAIIEAFNNAFDNNNDVLLIIKTMGTAAEPHNATKLQNICKNYNNIQLLDTVMTDAELDSLINATSVYVSLHRSEGLGITMMDAMAHGKPVIATNYSGNTDYMNKDNSILIDYKLINIDPSTPTYNMCNGTWADPDIKQVMSALLKLYNDKNLVATLGKKAKETICNHYSFAITSKLIHERLQK